MNLFTNFLLITTTALFTFNSILQAGSSADAHAPIGVMGDHTHKAGESMISYRYMTMQMNQIYRGTDSIPSNMSSTGYMMSPREMTMEMHMLGLMYAPTDQLTLMGMIAYHYKDMSMANAAGNQASTMKSSGIGDTSIGGLYQLLDRDKSKVHVGLSISLPTGSTNKSVSSAPMPAAIGRDLPYTMQLGSGTVDLSPSITYHYHHDHSTSFGSQIKSTIVNGTNDEGYSLGNSISLTAWASRAISPGLAINTRINVSAWSGISGTQTNGLHSMNPAMSSAADPANSGGQKTDLFVGLNYISPHGLRLATEIGKTLYQDLEGTQLGSDWSLMLGAQLAW